MTAKDERALATSTARVALFGTLVYAAVRFAGTYLDQYAIAAAVVQMVIAEWGVGRLGVAWSDPLAPLPTSSRVALRALRGAGMGLTAAAIVLGVSLATGAAHLAPNTPSGIVAVVDFVIPAFLAARDELLLRGLVLRVLPATAAVPIKLGACALASVAVAWGEGGATAPILVGALFGGLAYGALWLRDRETDVVRLHRQFKVAESIGLCR